MAEFSRIRVTPAEEEDIVILAGAVDEPTTADSDGHTVEEAVVEETARKETPVHEEAPSTTPQEPAAPYEETTLEDLQRTRMSSMQKAIIALAIVAVAVFIIWYVFLH